MGSWGGEEPPSPISWSKQTRSPGNQEFSPACTQLVCKSTPLICKIWYREFACKSLLRSQTHAMSPGSLSLPGSRLSSQLSLEQLGEPGMFFHENRRHCVAKKKMKSCLWTTLGARIQFSHSVFLKHQQWPTFRALMAHWQTHQSSRDCFSFVYLPKFPYGLEKIIHRGRNVILSFFM